MWKLNKPKIVSTSKKNFTKKCNKCLKVKNYYEFYIDREKPDGRVVNCIQCTIKKNKGYQDKIKQGTIPAF